MGDLTLLDQKLLLAIMRLHPDAYGTTIQDTLTAVGRTYSLGSIYSALDRLQDRGFIKDRQGDVTSERGGRRKTYFTLTAPGRHALQESLQSVDALRGAPPPKGVMA